MMILHLLSMISNHAQTFCQFIVIRKNSSTVTITSQIFRREKRSTAYVTDSSRMLLSTIRESIYCSNGLSIVFNHINTMLFGKLHNRFHITRLAKQMHRNNRFSFRTQSLFQIGNRYIEGSIIHIHHHRNQP